MEETEKNQPIEWPDHHAINVPKNFQLDNKKWYGSGLNIFIFLEVLILSYILKKFDFKIFSNTKFILTPEDKGQIGSDRFIT